MSKISYVTQASGNITVKLDGRVVGEIRRSAAGYRYHPLGGRPGDAFQTLHRCKASLEES